MLKASGLHYVRCLVNRTFKIEDSSFSDAMQFPSSIWWWYIFCSSLLKSVYRPHDISKTKSIESKSVQSFHKRSKRSWFSGLIPKFILGGAGIKKTASFRVLTFWLLIKHFDEAEHFGLSVHYQPLKFPFFRRPYLLNFELLLSP